MNGWTICIRVSDADADADHDNDGFIHAWWLVAFADVVNIIVVQSSQHCLSRNTPMDVQLLPLHHEFDSVQFSSVQFSS